MKTVAVLTALLVAAQAVLIPNLDQIVGLHKGLPVVDGIAESAAEDPDTRIGSGIEATRGQFPYQVGLVLDWNSFCGGSLISPRWVLSSGRCTNKTKVFTAILGATDLSIVEDGFAVRVTMEKIIHPSFKYETYKNDISLIDLEYEVVLTQYINTIKIAAGSNNYLGTLARASGWGVVDSSSASHITSLRYADVTIVDNEECVKSYTNPIIYESSICSSSDNGRSSCRGDIGGPLVDLTSGVQIGVMSITPNYCTTKVPVGYTRVSSFASWIHNTTGIEVGSDIKTCINTCLATYQKC